MKKHWQHLQPGNSDLLQGLASQLASLGGMALGASDLAAANLDDYYRMNVRVVDASGALLAQGRDLAQLVEQFREDTRQTINARQQDSPARSGITRWDFGELPREWRFRQAGVDIVCLSRAGG